MVQKKNSETGGVLLPTEKQTVDVTTEGFYNYLIYREINNLVLAGVANSITNLDGDSFRHKHMFEGMRQKCSAIECRKLSHNRMDVK